jgi:hypothetical protein
MTKQDFSELRLTPAQRRHLEVSLGQILREMEEAAVWFREWPLPGSCQEETLRNLKVAGSQIRAMAGKLGLSPLRLHPDPLHRLEALASDWWSTALDCRSAVLRGYGEVDPSAGPVLDPLVEELASTLLGLARHPRARPEDREAAGPESPLP